MLRYQQPARRSGCAMFSIGAADLGTARVIENVTFFNIPSFVAPQLRRLPHPTQAQRVSGPFLRHSSEWAPLKKAQQGVRT